MLEHLENVKKILPWVMVALAVILGLTIVFGGFFFNLDIAQIMSWFGFVILLVFVLAFVYVVFAFIGWFLFSSPYVIAFVAGALVVVMIVAIIFIKLVGGPIVDIESILTPIFSFLK